MRFSFARSDARAPIRVEPGIGFEVALLGIGERPSMQRFARELLRGFDHGPVRAQVGLPGDCPQKGGRVGRLVYRCERWGRQPLAARHVQADLFHIVDHSFADLSLLLPSSRTIATCHDLIVLREIEEGHRAQLPRSLIMSFRWRVLRLRQLAAVACPSAATRNDVVRLCGVDPSRTHVIPQGVDRAFAPLGEEVRNAARHSLADSAEHLVLHVSSGGFYKNIPTTLRVVGALRDSGLNVRLIRVGARLDGDESRLARELRMTHLVRELGEVSEERLVEIYNAADVLLFPSLYEGFGWPVLEAMACGTPAVTSCAPALEELAHGAALQAPAEDVKSLHDALCAVLLSRERSDKLRAAGLLRARDYSWERALSAYSSLYGEVLGRLAGPRSSVHLL